MKKLKAVVTLVLVVAVVVFAVQNSEVVKIQFLIWSFSAPRALLVITLLGIGFILGLFISSLSELKNGE